ncbi:hypothetical protein [Petroclostridium sp. X23]|nr:hypothetical protein [Petroclostridium sp. X23]WHH60061.1 hypothetical protein QKW49_04770 [Petroclostridium sp. X23]
MRKRSIRVQVWLNKEERTKLQTSAKKAGLSVSASKNDSISLSQ